MLEQRTIFIDLTSKPIMRMGDLVDTLSSNWRGEEVLKGGKVEKTTERDGKEVE